MLFQAVMLALSVITNGGPVAQPDTFPVTTSYYHQKCLDGCVVNYRVDRFNHEVMRWEFMAECVEFCNEGGDAGR